MPRNTLSFPNILTILRFLLSPLFFILLLRKDIVLALIIFILVAITDVIDGFVARSTKQKSSFGEMLDPMADKFMVFLALIALFKEYNFPAYGLLIISRDIISLLGSLLVFLKKHGNWKPNKWGKLTTFLQVLTIISYIVNLPFKNYLLALTIVISLLAGFAYFVRGIGILIVKNGV